MSTNSSSKYVSSKANSLIFFNFNFKLLTEKLKLLSGLNDTLEHLSEPYI